MKTRFVLLLGLLMALSLVGAPGVAAHGPAHGTSLPARIDLPDGFQPEGITKGRGSTVYVGSLVDGAIWKGNLRTGTGQILVPGVSGQVAVGTEYDRRTGRLWVAGGPTGLVRVYDARSGTLLETYDFGPGGFLNDLVATRKGVYVTDSFQQQLDVIPLGHHGTLPPPSAAFSLPLTGDIHYQANFNANGIVAKSGWLILVQSNTGQLFRVNPRTANARVIKLKGTLDVTNGDGLELHGRTLYVVRNASNLVAVLRLGSSLHSARWVGDLTSPGNLDFPTTGAFALRRLWVVNARFTTPPTPTTPYWITRLPAKP
jgi:sugar lactone lactonase YvrE